MRRIKWAVRKLFLHFQIQTKEYKMIRFGNSYGGFEVAIDLLPESPVIYSFGIGEDLSFSEEILNNLKKANVYAFDMTPKSIEYVNSNRLSKEKRFHFYPIGLANKDGKVKFHLPLNEAYVSGAIELHKGLKQECIEVEVKRLKTIMNELEHDHIDILKLDIEGSEFDVIPDILHSIGGED